MRVQIPPHECGWSTPATPSWALFFSTCGGSCGVLWSTVRLAADKSCEAVCWSPELQLYACVTGSGLRVMTSPNGVNWSNQPQLGSR